MLKRIPFKELARWSVRFTLAQCFLFYIVCFKYAYTLFPLDLPFMKMHDKTNVAIFILITYIGHFALLATLWILIPCLICAAICRRPGIVLPLGWMLAVLAVAFFLLDSQLYALYRTHLNATYIGMAFSGHANDLFNLSTLEWATLALVSIGLGLLQAILVRAVWKLNYHPMSTYPWLLCLVVGMMQMSYGLYFKSIGKKRNEYMIQTKSFPFYQKILLTWLPKKLGNNQLKNWGSGFFTQAKQVDAPVNYPKQTMSCTIPTKKPNILMIVVDTWRPDSLTPKIMPFTTELRKKSIDFQDHLSTGNGTQPGMFSLFYSVPSVYFESMLKYKHPPVLFQQAKAAGYDLGMFVSASSKIPNFKQTIYLNSDTQYDSPRSTDASLRDYNVTKRTQEWISKKRTKPFFALAFYDIAHAYCETPVLKKPFPDAVVSCNRLKWNRKSDPIPYLHRYFNTLYYTDGQIKDLLSTLKKQGLDDNTIVIITADHGQEFNDNKRGYWEHANNFSKYQISVPFMVLWPGMPPQKMTYRTSHYDLVPTLLQKIFSCNNPIADYSIGYNLFDNTPRDAVLVGSYINNAIVERDRITILWGDGEIEIQAPDTRVLSQAKPNVQRISKALNDMRRFYRP